MLAFIWTTRLFLFLTSFNWFWCSIWSTALISLSFLINSPSLDTAIISLKCYTCNPSKPTVCSSCAPQFTISLERRWWRVHYRNQMNLLSYYKIWVYWCWRVCLCVLQVYPVHMHVPCHLWLYILAVLLLYPDSDRKWKGNDISNSNKYNAKSTDRGREREYRGERYRRKEADKDYGRERRRRSRSSSRDRERGRRQKRGIMQV